MSENLVESGKNKPESSDSRVLGVSVRGWIALMLVGTVCVMSYQTTLIREPLYTLVSLAVGFYFGQKFSDNMKENMKKPKK